MLVSTARRNNPNKSSHQYFDQQNRVRTNYKGKGFTLKLVLRDSMPRKVTILQTSAAWYKNTRHLSLVHYNIECSERMRNAIVVLGRESWSFQRKCSRDVYMILSCVMCRNFFTQLEHWTQMDVRISVRINLISFRNISWLEKHHHLLKNAKKNSKQLKLDKLFIVNKTSFRAHLTTNFFFK